MECSFFFLSIIRNGELLLSRWHEVYASKPIISLDQNSRIFFPEISRRTLLVHVCGKGESASAVIVLSVPKSLQWEDSNLV